MKRGKAQVEDTIEVRQGEGFQKEYELLATKFKHNQTVSQQFEDFVEKTLNKPVIQDAEEIF